MMESIISALERAPDESVQVIDYTAALVSAPLSSTPPTATATRSLPRKLDYAARDEKNRTLGRQGEQWVLEYERRRLISAERSDLANSVEWVSDVYGDGAGYDIRSKDLNGADLFIEVKTTNGGELTPFLLSANELKCSRDFGTQFHLH